MNAPRITTPMAVLAWHASTAPEPQASEAARALAALVLKATQGAEDDDTSPLREPMHRRRT